MRRSEFFGLRNHGSIRAIQKILHENLRDKVTYQPCTTTLIRKLYDLPERREKFGKLVSLNMANDQSEARFGQDKETIIQQVARAIKLIEEKGCKIFYVLHCSVDDFMLPYLSEHNVHFDVKDFTYEMPDSRASSLPAKKVVGDNST